MTATLTPHQQPAEARRPLDAQCPFVSVIVPVRNEEAFIGRTLDQLLGQDYPAGRFEILVADGRSTDGTRDIVGEYAARHGCVRLLDNPRRWSSGGRNQAVRAALGEILIVIDGHCELDGPEYFRELAEAFRRSGADCVGRPQPLDVSGATKLQRAVAAARASWLGHHPDSHIYSTAERFVPPQSVAVAYRRSVFETVGLFDERFDACEDVEFNHRVDRAGLRCFFTPRVRARYVPRSDLRGLFRQMARYGRGRVRLARKHPETFNVRGFVPAVLLLGLAAGLALCWLSPWLMMLYAGAIALYASVVLLVSAALAVGGRDLALLPWLPLVFFTVHAGAGAGILLELLAGRAGDVGPPVPQGAQAGGLTSPAHQ
jgi:succinoglycan biosynthesis protein ExoA